eukprot:scaffold65038_cov65-Phaeocystis_antarctica.AAC.5
MEASSRTMDVSYRTASSCMVTVVTPPTLSFEYACGCQKALMESRLRTSASALEPARESSSGWSGGTPKTSVSIAGTHIFPQKATTTVEGGKHHLAGEWGAAGQTDRQRNARPKPRTTKLLF